MGRPRKTAETQPELTTEREETPTMPSDLAKMPEAELPTTNALMESMMESDAGMGYETTTGDDFAPPFLRILQDNAPQVKAGPRNIPNAKPGMFFNVATQEVLGDTLVVIPCHYRRSAVEWKPNRGGYVADHPVEAMSGSNVVKNELGQFVLPNGNYLMDTREFHLLVMRGAEWQPMVLNLSSTGSKIARQWLTKAMSLRKTLANGKVIKPALYSRMYAISTGLETNKKGDQWYGLRLEIGDEVQDIEMYRNAKAFYELMCVAKPNRAGEDVDAPGVEPVADNSDI